MARDAPLYSEQPLPSTMSGVSSALSRPFCWMKCLAGKKTILLGTTTMSVGAIPPITTAFGVPQLIVGRIVGGIGNGFNIATAPVTYGFSFVSGPVSWKMPLVLQFIFIILLFPTVPWLPESPRWLIAHGDIEQAEQIVADLEATTIDDPWLVTKHKRHELLPAHSAHPKHQFMNWAFKFMVVEITTIGIQTLHWRFYIIWTVFNAAFVPIVYLLYSETAGKTLEDIDRFSREDAKIIVFRYKDAISEKRPMKYVEHEQSELRRDSSVVTANPETVRQRLASIARANEEGGWGHEEKT
ncbi:MAG: hypothetical protein Q9185_000564 [Variospora sp. 1 TL-2023]